MDGYEKSPIVIELGRQEIKVELKSNCFINDIGGKHRMGLE